MNILRLKPNTLGRDFIVGDLHGCYSLLENELNKANFNDTKDRLFSVGDLIDRGPESLKCAKLIYEPWFFVVQGNHEQMFIHAMLGEECKYIHRDSFYLNGGLWVIDPEIPKQELVDIARDMYKLPLIIQVGNEFVITHAKLPDTLDLRQEVNLDARAAEILTWDRSIWDDILEYEQQVRLGLETEKELLQLTKLDKSLPIIYVGHNTTNNGIQVFINQHMMLDTGAYILDERTKSNRTSNARLSLVEHSKVKEILR